MQFLKGLLLCYKPFF